MGEAGVHRSARFNGGPVPVAVPCDGAPARSRTDAIFEGMHREFLSLIDGIARNPLFAIGFFGGTYGLMRLKKIGPVIQKFFYLMTGGLGGFYLGRAGAALYAGLNAVTAPEEEESFIRMGESLLPLGFCVFGLVIGFPRDTTVRDEWAMAVTVIDKFDDILIFGNLLNGQPRGKTAGN